jgi:ribulose-5-phosphate 4-epimerase/fuculose-1-phosphate aldolase
MPTTPKSNSARLPSKPGLSESQAREEICRVGKSLFDRGYVHATAGNISVRLDDGFLITPTDACLGQLDPARLAKLNLAGEQVSGDKASKTIALHRAIYQASQPFDSDTRCVIHTHSSYCVARSLVLQNSGEPELLPALTPYFVMKVGHVPHIAYDRPGSPDVAQAVAQAIEEYGQAGRPIRAVMLSRLGPNVWHDSPPAAMAVLEELEETAKLAMLTMPTNSSENQTVAPLSSGDILALKKQFNARW